MLALYPPSPRISQSKLPPSRVAKPPNRPPPAPPTTPATPGDRLDALTARAQEMSVKVTVMLNECFLLELESQS